MSLDELLVDAIPEIEPITPMSPPQMRAKVVNASTEIFGKCENPWNDERINRLKQMWGDGATASECANALSDRQVTITRSAVIGKVHRLELPARKPRLWPEGEARKPRPRKPRIVMRMRSRPLLDPPIERAPEPLPVMVPAPAHGQPVDIGALEGHHCRYIVSADGEETMYCGSQKVTGYPYCAYHCSRCYNFPKS